MRVVHPKPDDLNFHNRVHRTVAGYVATDEYTLHIPLMSFKSIIYYFTEYVIFNIRINPYLTFGYK